MQVATLGLPLLRPLISFALADGKPNLVSVLDCAIDVSRAMAHLHAENIIHSDLKPRNVLLKGSSMDARGFVAKVADFGLSVRIDPMETHISNSFQVRGKSKENGC